MQVENLVAVQQVLGAEIKFLGSLLWYTISECRMTMADLEAAFSGAGLDKEHLPKPISPRDAFRRATTAAETRRRELEKGKDHYLNILIREVKVSENEIIRHLVREIVDSANVRLDYRSVVEVSLDHNVLMVNNLGYALNDIERAALERIRADFEIERTHYSARTVRTIVAEVLQGCDPVAVRSSGGVYFTPAKYETTIRAVQTFINDYAAAWVIDKDAHSRLWTVPVIDVEEQRRMLEESLEDQIRSESAALVQEMAELIKGDRKVRQRTAEQYVERVRNLGRMVSEYEEMLETEVVTAKANLDLAMKEAMALLATVEVETEDD